MSSGCRHAAGAAQQFARLVVVLAALALLGLLLAYPLALGACRAVVLGDEKARGALVALLLSEDEYTRRLAIEALLVRYRDDRGFEPDADLESRRAAVKRWATEAE